jgi:hypothetical protein
MRLLVESMLGDATIYAFVDSNPINQGKRLRGVLILAPQQLRDMQEWRSIPIVVASTIHSAAIAATIRQQLGLSNPLVLLQ